MASIVAGQQLLEIQREDPSEREDPSDDDGGVSQVLLDTDDKDSGADVSKALDAAFDA